MNGERGDDLDEFAVNVASLEALIAAGRPEGYELLSEYEAEAWRVWTRRVLRAYRKAELS